MKPKPYISLECKVINVFVMATVFGLAVAKFLSSEIHYNPQCLMLLWAIFTLAACWYAEEWSARKKFRTWAQKPESPGPTRPGTSSVGVRSLAKNASTATL
jgi:hypothetical protein